ncbi:hypothetical protein LCGC14_2820970 [marine sediment metagenome]|uniref:Uncharacterized protein n=1 Tax=marine sediment metagenome TaxID=412755 RepID=A0A0F9B880_9ZZZZ
MTRFGFTRPTRPRSATTSVRFIPTEGFTELPDIEAPPGSITSGQNVWIRHGRLEPRWRLQQAADNILNDLPTGAFDYDDVGGARFPVVASQDTVAFLNNDSYVSLQYVSGTSNFPPTSGQNDTFFGTPDSSALFGTGFFNRAKFFEQVFADAGNGGNDVAELHDSALNDLLDAQGDVARLTNEDLGAIFQQATKFDTVTAFGTTGTNRRDVRLPLSFVLQFNGTWIDV